MPAKPQQAPRHKQRRSGQSAEGDTRKGNAPRKQGLPRHTGIQRRKRQARRDNEVYAAIDLGTNNCRLLVARRSRKAFRVVDTFSRIVRLGEGLSQTERLSDDAVRRTMAALKICASKIRRQGVTRMRCVATEACRRAQNGEAFIAQVEEETGLKLEIIDNNEEAQLAILGCAPLLNPNLPESLIFDIGGGSTEVSWITNGPEVANSDSEPKALTAEEVPSIEEPAARNQDQKRKRHRKGDPAKRQKASEEKGNGQARRSTVPVMKDWHSVPIGVVALAEKFGGRDITPEKYEAMVEEVYQAFRPFEEKHNFQQRIANGQLQMLGTSGTVTTLVGIYKKLPRYDRNKVDGSRLRRDVALRLCKKVSRMNFQERIANPCIGKQRADLVVAGCAIFEAIVRLWPVDDVRVADRGLREGILFRMMNERKKS
ncbi:Ppx/GppA phosphatase family protein [Kiloniella sp. b19]|uniref:Ppx/GppA phosphatase family protein n=1 Tax=Kiloniella sp. GXU_MW_B19 TaxID=3141326 RepID=UPI0031E44271